MRTFSLTVALLATACRINELSSQPLPGAAIDTVGASPGGGTVSAQSARPCGYKISEDWVNYDRSTQHDEITVSITYGPSGLDISEQGVDGNHNVVIQNSSDYDSAGNLIQYTYLRNDPNYSAKATEWAAYDSFGRLVRYSEDDDGDGEVDVVTTFAYGGDGRRASAHSATTSSLFGPSANYDRYYRYDTEGRLAETDKDVGYNGSIDEILLVHYDDDARIETRTRKDLKGTVIGNGTTYYDAEYHISNAEDVFIRNNGTDTYEYAYLDGRALSQSLTSENVRASDLAMSEYVWTLTYNYGRCN